MSWAKLDDKANEHVKQLRAGSEACWLWACGLMYANRQAERDGFIPDEAVPILYGPARNPMRLAKRLAEVGLWDRVDGGYLVHNYHQWNPTQAQIEEERAKGRERAAASYARRKQASSPEDTEPLRPKKSEDAGEDKTKKHDSSGSTRVDPLRLHSDSTPTPEIQPVDDQVSMATGGGPGEPAPLSPSASSEPAKRISSKPVPIPAAWEPSSGQVDALAAKHGVRPERIRAEVSEFRWYWSEGGGAGKRRSPKGWAQAFGNRVDEQAKRGILFAEREATVAGPRQHESRADFQLRRQIDRVKQLELEERDIRDLEAIL